MRLPSRGWGPWRQEFYSLHSNPNSIKKDTEHRFGLWHNVWVTKVSSAIYDRWPGLWRTVANLPLIRSRYARRLRKFFPRLR